MLVGGPLAIAVLAVAQAATLGSGWLSSGSDTADALLLGFSLLVIVVSALMGGWQHRAIVRPLRELARSAGAGTCTDAVCGGTVAREIALLGQRLAPNFATPERDPLTGLLSAAGLHANATPDLESEHAGGGRWLLIVADIERLRDVNGLHGFGFGDEVLRQFARRLSSMCVRARPGGTSGGRPVRAAHAGFRCRGQQSAGDGYRILSRPFRIAGWS